jgi:hypothetical protein
LNEEVAIGRVFEKFAIEEFVIKTFLYTTGDALSALQAFKSTALDFSYSPTPTPRKT